MSLLVPRTTENVTHLPRNDSEVIEKLMSAPVGTRELLQTGVIGTVVGEIGDQLVLRNIAGDFLCPHGEKYKLLAERRVKPVCECDGIRAAELAFEGLDDLTYGLREDETLVSFLRERRYVGKCGLTVFAYGNVYIKKTENSSRSHTVVCKHGKSLETFKGRDKKIEDSLAEVCKEALKLEPTEDGYATLENNIQNSCSAPKFANKMHLFNLFLTKKLPSQSLQEKLDECCTNKFPVANWASLTKPRHNYIGCLCVKPIVVNRDGSFVRANPLSKVPSAGISGRRVSKKRPRTETSGLLGFNASHGRSKCAHCERKIDVNSNAVVYSMGKAEPEKIYHLECAYAQFEESDIAEMQYDSDLEDEKLAFFKDAVAAKQKGRPFPGAA